jgi:hypothetical protein
MFVTHRAEKYDPPCQWRIPRTNTCCPYQGWQHSAPRASRFYGCLILRLYNHVRPHSALADRAPVEVADRWSDLPEFHSLPKVVRRSKDGIRNRSHAEISTFNWNRKAERQGGLVRDLLKYLCNKLCGSVA